MAEGNDYAKLIKSKINIVDYIGKDLNLIRSGENYKALCPFHNEKTPSFTINENKESFRCFGCGKSGDIFSYVMEKLKINFSESLKMLAAEAGIIIKDLSRLENDEIALSKKKNKYFEVMQLISHFYHSKLKSYLTTNTLPFVIEKSLNKNIIEKYQLGLSSKSNELEEFLNKKNFNTDFLIDLKIFKLNKFNKVYDVFSNRFIFPIKDKFNRVIGFGGRSLSRDGPKYINSSENEFFKKRHLLYNMNNLKNLKSREHALYIVEGYTDVIAMESKGYNAIAPLGTAVSKEQLYIAWKYVNEPTILFDGDEAGIKAAFRVLDMALSELEPEKTLNFVFLENDQDPDSLLKTDEDQIQFEKIINKKNSFIESIIKSEIKNKLDSPERIINFKNKLLNKLERIKNSEVRNMYKLIIKEKLKKTFRESINYVNYNPLKSNKDNQFVKNFKDRKEEQFVLRRERSILGAMINNFNLLKNTDEVLAELHISNNELSSLRDAIIEIISEEKVEKSEQLKNFLINKGFSNIIKNHFQTKDCKKFNLIENYAKENTDIKVAKKALMNVILLQENWYKKKNKNLLNIT